jgi:hypothetical protein
VGPSLKLLTILGDRRPQCLCPLGCRGPLRPVLRTQHTLQSLLPRACIPLVIHAVTWRRRELTRRIDSSPASVCAPTAEVGRCCLGFVWRGGCFHAGAETISIPPTFICDVCEYSVVREEGVGLHAHALVHRFVYIMWKLLFVTKCHFRGCFVSLFILFLK